MARGAAQASTVARREAKTRELFDTLSEAQTPEERQRITTELVELNLPLCDALATRYLGRGVDFDDLVQVARTALWVAIQRFRPSESRSLASYAVPTITGELKRYFRDHCWVVRPPRQIQDLGSLTSRTTEGLEQASGRKVTVREIGDALGVDQKQVAECIIARAGYRPLSLDATTGDAASVGLVPRRRRGPGRRADRPARAAQGPRRALGTRPAGARLEVRGGLHAERDRRAAGPVPDAGLSDHPPDPRHHPRAARAC
jgi:DNA-directed RNA polymerase sigma subunit (sigma70/sigma32)